jgi:hypothetical protein
VVVVGAMEKGEKSQPLPLLSSNWHFYILVIVVCNPYLCAIVLVGFQDYQCVTSFEGFKIINA